MNMRNHAALLASIGALMIADKDAEDRRYLEQNGWVCLGEEAESHEVHWTNLERGLQKGGPVTFYHAKMLQRSKDAIARQQEKQS